MKFSLLKEGNFSARENRRIMYCVALLRLFKEWKPHPHLYLSHTNSSRMTSVAIYRNGPG